MVAQGDSLRADPDGRAPGRGAYLHRSTACLDTALRRRAFPRALRVPAPLDGEALRAHVEQIETSTTDSV